MMKTWIKTVLKILLRELSDLAGLILGKENRVSKGIKEEVSCEFMSKRGRHSISEPCVSGTCRVPSELQATRELFLSDIRDASSYILEFTRLYSSDTRMCEEGSQCILNLKGTGC